MSRPNYVHARRREPEIDPRWIAVGVIVGAVGIKGAVRLKSFCDDLSAVFDRGPVTIFPDPHSPGELCSIHLMHQIKVGYACGISGIQTRDEAEALKGLKLYIARDNLPELEEEDSFYHDDITGLSVRDAAGNFFGVVTAIYNFGAGDLLEVTVNGDDPAPILYPFRDEFVPEVNIKEGFVVIDREAFEEVREPQ